MVTRRFVLVATTAAAVLGVRDAAATDYYVASPTSVPAGSDTNAGTSTAAPFKTIRKAAGVAKAGDTVFLRGGTYTEAVNLSTSGTSSAWITFSAYPGELPILDGGGTGGTGFSSATAQFIRVVGIAARNWSSSGFGNGWVNDVGTSNGNWQFVNCIADGNGINGITFYNASGLLIDESLAAHNGNMMPSWSSGINLFHLSGDFTTNVVRRTVSFENIDISTTHSTPAGGATDGSGFILDQNSSGALFENDLGFRNGGSCIRINTPGAHIVNSTCYHDGLDPNDKTPSNPGEIYFSAGPQGAIMIDNLLAASGFDGTMNAVVNGPTGTSSVDNVLVNMNGATPFFTNPANVDFTLVSGSSTVIDEGSTTSELATDIGFDPKCVSQQTGLPVPWWSYGIDYAYIASVGGVAGCFHPAVRPQGAGPDVGAYEFGGQVADAGSGTTSSSGSSGGSSSGQSTSSSGSASASSGSGGSVGLDGSTSGSSSASPGSGGDSGSSTRADGGDDDGEPQITTTSSGCSCRTIPSGGASAGWLVGLGAALAGLRRRRCGTARRADPRR